MGSADQINWKVIHLTYLEERLEHKSWFLHYKKLWLVSDKDPRIEYAWWYIDMQMYSSITGSLWEEPIGHSDDFTRKSPVMQIFHINFIC